MPAIHKPHSVSLVSAHFSQLLISLILQTLTEEILLMTSFLKVA